MNSPVCGLRLASIAAGLGCLAHLVRLFLGFQIVIGSHPIPAWLSGVAVVVLGVVSGWLWKLSLLAQPSSPAAS
jgi:hypothetical protein